MHASGRTLRWTFPLRFAEVVSGDGEKVYRQRIDLSDTEAFGQKELQARRQALRPEVGPARGLGRRRQRGLHPAGLARIQSRPEELSR